MKQLETLALAIAWTVVRLLKFATHSLHHQLRQIQTPESFPERSTLAEAADVVTIEAAVVKAAVVSTAEPATPQTVALAIVPSRREVVEALLDEAWQQGHTTYPALMDYITEKTGAGCSRRTISEWKKQRGITKAA